MRLTVYYTRYLGSLPQPGRSAWTQAVLTTRRIQAVQAGPNALHGQRGPFTSVLKWKPWSPKPWCRWCPFFTSHLPRPLGTMAESRNIRFLSGLGLPWTKKLLANRPSGHRGPLVVSGLSFVPWPCTRPWPRPPQIYINMFAIYSNTQSELFPLAYRARRSYLHQIPATANSTWIHSLKRLSTRPLTISHIPASAPLLSSRNSGGEGANNASSIVSRSVLNPK